jgi:hypothetical protein
MLFKGVHGVMMKNKNMDIELLYFDDCPSWKNALITLEEIVEEYGMSSKISLIRVETQEEAVLHGFVGSPTIRVNKKDLFPTDQDQFALGCRIYQTSEGLQGWPTKEMLLEKLKPLMSENE